MVADGEVEVLLHESDHVQQAIGRAIGTIYALFGIVLPGVFGAIIIATSKGNLIISQAFIGLILASIVSIAILYANGLWVEAFEYMRYKYGVVHPRLYAAIGKTEWKNFMQFMKLSRKKESWLPTIFFQGTVTILTLIYSLTLIASDWSSSMGTRFLLGILSVGLTSLAGFSSNHTRKHWLEVTHSVEKVSLDSNH